MKKFVITEEEKSRILGMHKSRTSNHYLMEQSETIVAPTDAYNKLVNLEDGTEGTREEDNIKFGNLVIGPIGFNDSTKGGSITMKKDYVEKGPVVMVMEDGENILLFSEIPNFEFMKLGV